MPDGDASAGVAIVSVRSLLSLGRVLARTSIGSPILGADDGNKETFWVASSRLWRGQRVGICGQRSRFGPAFASRMQEGDPWFVGFGQRVAIVDPITSQVLVDAPLQAGVFFTFLEAGSGHPLIAIFEVGVSAYRWDGQQAWFRPFAEVINGWRIQGSALELTCLEGSTVSMAIDGGQLLQPKG